MRRSKSRFIEMAKQLGIRVVHVRDEDHTEHGMSASKIITDEFTSEELNKLVDDFYAAYPSLKEWHTEKNI